MRANKILEMETTQPLVDAVNRSKWCVAFVCACGHEGFAALDDLVRRRPRMTMEGLVVRGKCTSCAKAGRASELMEVRLETWPHNTNCRPDFWRIVYLAPGRVAQEPKGSLAYYWKNGHTPPEPP